MTLGLYPREAQPQLMSPYTLGLGFISFIANASHCSEYVILSYFWTKSLASGTMHMTHCHTRVRVNKGSPLEITSSIVIKPADKGETKVNWPTTQYISE